METVVNRRTPRRVASILATFGLVTGMIFFGTGTADAATGTWSLRAPIPTGLFSLGAATGSDGTIYAIGGSPPSSQAVATLNAYDPLTDTWTARADMPTGLSALGSAVGTDGKIYAIGGNTACCGPVNVAEAYDPLSDTWTTLAPMPTSRNNLGAATASDGKIYAMGGNSYPNGDIAAVEAYDPATDTWTSRAPMPTPRQGLAVVAAPDGKIYAIGGYNPSQGALDTVEAYDPSTDTWTTRASMPTRRYYYTGTLGPDGKIYVFSGFDQSDTLVNTVEAYDPSTDTWTTADPTPTPLYQAAATTGSDGTMYLIAGYSPSDGYTDAVRAYTLDLGMTFELHVSVVGEGSVTNSPSGIDCGPGCESYDVDTQVTLTAAPQAGSRFVGWSGGSCSGSSATCTVTMNQSISVNASFASTAAPPSAPRNPSGVPGNGSVTVSWLAPSSSGGAPITRYTVVNTFASSGALAPDVPVDAPSLTVVVPGLTNGVSYRFKVYATNAGGNSPLSAQTGLITPRTVPGPPTIGMATPGPSRATVTWSAPASNGGSAITGYTIATFLNGSPVGSPVNAGANATSFTVTGLTNGQSYTFTVYARNAAGNGAPSAQSNAVVPSSPPGAPAAPTAVAGNGSAQVSWSPPASNGGGPITSYTVTSSTGGFSATVDGSTTSTTIAGLTNGTSYRFRVRATNAAGPGPYSPLSPAVIPRGNPLAPSGVAVVAGDRIALVQWSAPTSNGGSPITQYVVTAHPGGQSTTVTMSNSTIPGAIVAGLENGTTYTFTVAARNASGLGPDSAMSSSATPLSSARTIVFSSTRAGSSGQDIWAMDEAGLVSVRLLLRAGTDTGPRISPDRTKVVFASGSNDAIDIWTMNIDGSGLSSFPGNSTMADTAPNWSPDGTKLVLQSMRHDENPQVSGTDYEIWVIDSDGTDPHQLTHTANNVNDTYPDWSPDGSRVVFTSNRPGSLAPTNQELWIVAATGGTPTQLTAKANGDVSATWSIDSDPSPSVDNSRIAFTSLEPGGVTNIYVIKPDGTGLTLLTHGPTVNHLVGAWASNGQDLVISAREPGSSPGTNDLYRLVADGTSAPVRLTTAAGVDATPDWAGSAYGVVTRQGSELQVQGQPFRFTGLNIYNANSDGWCWYAMDAPVLEDSLAAIGPGTEVIRAWFFQPLATTKGATRVRDWARFDHTLQAADEAGMKVIVTLTDQWGECGSDQPNGYKDSTWYEAGYEEVQPGNLVSYRDWAREVVTRYRDDPRVAFWQLINEAEYGERLPDGSIAACPQGTDLPADVLKAWATDVSGLIKSIDPNHLVSLGSIGNGQCGMQGPQYEYVHDIPTIDLCEYHDYGSPLDPSPGDQFNGLEVRAQQCNDLNKPLFLGEVGIIPNEVGGSLQARADAFASKRDAMFALGADGFLMWAWNKDGSLLDNYDIGPGDPALP